MEKELNNCGNTRKALYLRLYSVYLNYTIRAYERYAAYCGGSSAEDGIEQAGAFEYLHDGEYLCARDSLRGRGCGGYAGGYSGV